MDSFASEAVRAANDGTYVKGAAQIVHEYGERERSFVSDFAVPRFLLQVYVSFEPESRPGAESLVKVDHLRLVFTGEAFAFGELHPFGVGLEFALGAGNIITQLKDDNAQKFGHALCLRGLFCR